MTSVKRPPADHTVGGSIPATDEFYTRHMRMANGNAAAHASRSEGSAYSSSGVPKMGVRARVAEWPPRKEGRGPMLRSIHKYSASGLQALKRGRSPVGRSDSPDARFLSAQRGATRRIRQRSNSDVTLSELDAGGESGDDWGSPATPGAKWSPVHRVYGSTSSIDQHPGDSILELLKGLQSEASGEQRSPAAERLEELLNAADQQGLTELTDDAAAQQQPSRARDKPPKRRSKSETGGESIFRKLRGVRGDVDSPRAGSDAEDGRGSEDCGLPVGSGPPLKPWVCQRGFTHYDVQSIVFDLNEVIQSRQTAPVVSHHHREPGAPAVAASSASASSTLSSTHSLPYSSPSGSQEELSGRDDPAETQSNELVLGCPFFRTETGGDGREQDEPAPAETGTYESPLTPYCMNAGVAVLEGQKDGPNALNDRNKQYIIEHVDLGAYYYRKYFYLRDHWNYFGLDEALGPVALSVRREKLDDHKDHGPQYNYRVIFRTSELSFQVKVGMMLPGGGSRHRGGMYNSQGGPARPATSCSCWGRKSDSRASPSTGLNWILRRIPRGRTPSTRRTRTTRSCSMCPLCSRTRPTTSNSYSGKGTLERHESRRSSRADSAFRKNIRSHFQHVFIIVQVHNPCCDDTCYSVAVTRSRDVPSFGPPVPRGVTFPKSTVFRDFLLAKVVNAENAAHKSDKFRAMATRTRQEYLRDLAERHVTATPVEPAGKFPFISLAHRKRERSRPYSGAELRGPGALTWLVHAEDQTAGAERECVLAVSSELLLLLDRQAKAVVFSCAVRDVIGWSLGSPASMKIFYERGESVSLRSINNNTEDFGEVVKRLELLSKGCQTTEMTLRRNALGQLGFHVNFEGIVAEVEPYGYAWQAGLRQGSRLVEICKVSVASLTHEQMIDLLRTSVTVKVVIIPPHEDSTPRRGCSEMYHMPLVDYKNHKEGMPYELKFPFRSNNNNKWPRSSGSPQQTHGVSSDGRPLNPKRSAGRYSPGSDNYALACSIVMGRSPHMRNSPSGAPYGSDANTAGASHWRQKSMPEGFNANRNSPLVSERQNLNEVVNGVKVTPCWPRVVDGEAPRGTERTPTEPPTTKPKPAISTAEQLDGGSTHSPCKSSKTEPPYSSQSSSNTLSSTASSSTHSDEKCGYLQGASTDSGIDATSYGATLTSNAPLILPPRAKEKTPSASASCAWSEASSPGRRASDVPSPPAEASSISPVDSPEEPAKSPNNYPPAPDASAYPRSDAASHSSTLSSGHSGSPLGSGAEESAPPRPPPTHHSPPGPRASTPAMEPPASTSSAGGNPAAPSTLWTLATRASVTRVRGS
ncbi:hypothetical protein AALO_G00241830 [Alosa alosa]|uniref:Signal-induced proliferation-associated 1-like protein 1 n=1 Tax=Alosa alosa TaxID=278164 RepID=A0AAV6FVJ0_9TELE|nr:hypothetical protein AALO_G00241830 [Alosa alosa]